MSSKRSPGTGASAFVGGLMFILLFSGFGGVDSSAPAPIIDPECNDTLDNDGDGGIDSVAIFAHDPECRWIDPLTGIEYQCPGWHSESVGPTSEVECTSS